MDFATDTNRILCTHALLYACFCHSISIYHGCIENFPESFLLFLRKKMYTNFRVIRFENYWTWHSWTVNCWLVHRFNCFTFFQLLFIRQTINSYYCFELMTKNKPNATAFIFYAIHNDYFQLIFNDGWK